MAPTRFFINHNHAAVEELRDAIRFDILLIKFKNKTNIICKSTTLLYADWLNGVSTTELMK